MTQKAIYVDYDCILDTRLGTLITVSSEFGFEVSNQENYYLRTTDSFKTDKHGILSKEIFNRVKEGLSTEIIVNSPSSRLSVFLVDLVSHYLDASRENDTQTLEIHVNFNGSGLDGDTCNKVAYAFQKKIENFAVCRAINIPITNITPSYLRDGYVCAVMYNPSDWLNKQTENLKKTKLTGFKLYTPKINHLRDPTDEEKKTLENQKIDLYRNYQLVLAPFISLEFLSIALFCADTPKNLPEYYEFGVAS